ncbi:bifunctional folylpolyglutamate synthase/dihydrofolate synthase [Clostridia bacterium]|nr:bifunctional folylpolyglutamate synthase/dihydrofolate synthase [Clostridia bacterium]
MVNTAEPIESMAAALAFIHDTRYRGGKAGLAHMRLLMARLGNPQDRLRCIHIAGTNGKGSVCAFIQAALRCAGYRTGLYTSPYLQLFNERIRVDGVNIPDADLIRITARVADAVESMRNEGIHPTEFEIITAIGFVYFDEARVDAVVVEVGMGGRLDSTNIIAPLVTAVTSIDLDHTKALGSTVEQIAFEKAGIAKPGVPMVVYPGAAEAVVGVIREHCEAVGAPLTILHNDSDVHPSIGLLGEHQSGNAATARAVCLALRGRGLNISDSSIAEGLRRAAWPGRLEWVKPRRADFPRAVLLDGAHNPQGARALTAYLDSLARPITAIVGMLREKDSEGFARTLIPHVHRVLTVTPDSHRAVSVWELSRTFAEAGKAAQPCPTIEAALHLARSSAEYPLGWCVVAGSLYLVGETRTLLDAPPCTLLDKP